MTEIYFSFLSQISNMLNKILIEFPYYVVCSYSVATSTSLFHADNKYMVQVQNMTCSYFSNLLYGLVMLVNIIAGMASLLSQTNANMFQ